MYQYHFGLQQAVCGQGLLSQGELYLGEAQQRTLKSIAFGLGAPDSVTLIAGPHGVGKSVLTQAALADSGTRQALIRLRETGLNAHDLLELLLAELGVPAHRMSRVERLQLWRQSIGELDTTESRLFVIVERADAADVAVLRALEALTTRGPDGSPGANLLLLGQPHLAQRLNVAELTPLCQRIRQVVSVEPMDIEDATGYWCHKLGCLGADPDRVMAAGANEALFFRAGGLPRMMNNLGDAALALAALQGAPMLTAAHIHEAADGMTLAPRVAGESPAEESAQPSSGDQNEGGHHHGDDRNGGTQLPVLTDVVGDDAEPAEPIADAWVDRLLSA